MSISVNPVSSVDPSAIVVAAAPRRDRRTRSTMLVADATFLASCDSAVALSMLALVLVATNLESMPEGIDHFLSMRITLKNVLLLMILTAAWPRIFRVFGVYNPDRIREPSEEAMRIWGACGVGTLIAMAFPLLSTAGGITVTDLIYFWILTSAVTIAGRRVRRRLLDPRGAPRRVLVVGTGTGAMRMSEALMHDPSSAYQIAGFLDHPDAVPASAEIARGRLGTLDDLEPTLMHQAIDEVCIALPVKSQYRSIQEILRVCERLGVRTRYRVDLFESEVAWPEPDDAGSLTVTMHVAPDERRLVIKRLVDMVGASIAIVVLSPVLLGAALAIKLTSPGPVIFAQERYGLNRRRFRMFKFRTMIADAERYQPELEDANEADGPVFKIADDPRITPVGRFLRRSSIDELPQLFNVLTGDMSLVGPRPLPVRDVSRFTRPADMRRFSMPPGLTCLWQINGRSSLNFSEWIRLDLEYIDRWSLLLDMQILVWTIPAVLRGDGAE